MEELKMDLAIPEQSENQPADGMVSDAAIERLASFLLPKFRDEMEKSQL